MAVRRSRAGGGAAPPVRSRRAATIPGRVWLVYAAIVALILLWGPTLATRQLVQSTLLILLGVLGIEALRRQSVTEFPEAAAGRLEAEPAAALARR